jgi:hypothetical protein
MTVAGATLTFEVDLINVGDTPPPVNVFKEIDADKDLMLSREEVRDCGEAPFSEYWGSYYCLRTQNGWFNIKYICTLTSWDNT